HVWGAGFVRAGRLTAAPPVGGTAAGDFPVGGTFGSPSLDGAVDATLTYASMPPARIRARASIAPGAIDVRDIDARAGESRAGGSFRWTSDTDAIGGALNGSLRLTDVAAISSAIPASLALGGTADVPVALSGSLAQPRAAIHGEGRALSVYGETVEQLSTDARLVGQELSIDRLLLESEGGRVEGSGTVHLARETYTARITASDVPIHPVLGVDAATGEREAPLSATVSGSFEGGGSFAQPGGRGRMSIAGVRWRDADVGRVTGDFTLADRKAAFAFDAPDVALK